ncbi:putative sulfoacetate transporter SauU [Caulifigura coniformis]|uniref:Putative sulfoacetate transporter SauU n=1 Tax=Caulifigura coniformis TaxID=2527983 RepID=A0A517SHQ2_9PLAN|nr:MFS transporter [Caulifigura coniformis]QDT55654.1 putative sulfoacetate transporter SauU [Caulifigura coniformis]
MQQRIRHRVVFLAFLTSVLLYLDRFVLSYTERLIKLDLGLTEDQMSWGLSAFFWSYALFQVPSGLLTDRYGPRRMLTVYILLWSLGTALMGWMNGFAMLIAVRLGIGLAQAGAYPTCAAIVGRWVPLKSRGTASGLIAVGGRIGGGIAPLLTAVLVMSLAAKDNPDLDSSDIVAPIHLARQIQFRGHAFEPYPGLTDDQNARWKIASSLTESFRTPDWDLIDEASSNFVTVRGSYKTAMGMAPQDFGVAPKVGATSAGSLSLQLVTRLRDLLNRRLNGTPIATVEDLQALPVEREAVDLLATSTISNNARANRLILEAAFPGCIRPLYSAGWRPVMLVYGLAGILIAALYWIVVRDSPARHPRISREELAEIEAGRPPQMQVDASQARPPLPLQAMLRSTTLWLLSGSQFFGNIAWTFLVLQLPRYLQEAHHLSFADRSFYASVPLWCGWGGMFVGGIATDRCVKRFGLRLGRVIPLVGSRLLGTAAFLGLLLEPSLPIALALLSLVAIAADFASPATWAFNQDIGGRFIASTLGWGNMWGNIGSALSPLILASVLKQSGSWTGPFLVCAATYAIAGLCALFVDPRKSIDPGA